MTLSLNPACFKNMLILLTISSNLSFDQSTVSNLFTITANWDIPKKLIIFITKPWHIKNALYEYFIYYINISHKFKYPMNVIIMHVL